MKVFISYRREDSAGYTGRLYDSLRPRIGDDNLFLDLSGIDSGQNFVDVIQTAIHSCDVALAVIGPEWLTCAAGGRRRLDDPDDLVRNEILTALNARIPLIPVLVGGARPPAAAALPEPLQPLAAIDAHEMSDERWQFDAERLIQAIAKLARTRTHAHRLRSWMVAAAALVAVGAGGFVAWRSLSAQAAGSGAAIEAGPANSIAGNWEADVAYEWGARYTERLVLIVDGTEVSGTASFLGIPRGIVAGTMDGDRVTFQTRTREVGGDWNQPREVVHRYRGRLEGDTLALSMQSDGGSSQAVVTFTARRSPAQRR